LYPAGTQSSVSAFLFYTMENTITEEIILQPDGKFYKRKAVTTYLMSQEEAIQKVKAKPIYQVCPIPVNNTECPTYFSTYAGDDAHAFYLTTEIPEYPFPGAHIEPRQDEDGNTRYVLCMQRPNDPLPEDVIRNDSLQHTPAYIPNPNERLFLTMRYSYMDNSIETGEPMLFLYDGGATDKSYALNLPNIFDGGRICTGNEWPRRLDSCVLPQVISLHIGQVEHILTSLANNDLRSRDLEMRHLTFDVEGKHINTVPPSEGSKHFFQEITNEQILLFTEWLNNGQAI
jgi:hypothetical protein